MAAYHYAHLQRQYQAQVQAAIQQARGTAQQQQQSQARYPYDSSMLHYAYLNGPGEFAQAQQQQDASGFSNSS
jgi:hypothetical protein